MRLLATGLALAILLSGCSDSGGGGDADGDTTTSSSPSTTSGGTSGNGTGNGSGPAPAPETLQASAEGFYPINPTLEPDALEVTSGAQVTVQFENNDVNPVVSHNWVLEGVTGAATDQISPGETTEMTFTAPAAGEYTFYCSIGDHRDRGMEGTLTVS